MEIQKVISEIDVLCHSIDKIYSSGIEFFGEHVQLKTNVSVLIECIKAHLHYQYNSNNDVQNKWEIICFEDRSIYNQNKMLFIVANDQLEYGDPAYSCYHENYKLIVPEKTRSVFLINYTDKKIIILGYDLRGLFIDSYKTIRRVFTNLMMDKKIFCLHASGVERDNEAIIFVGKKGSGKTTSVLHIMSEIDSVGYINNDKLWIRNDNNNMTIGTWPTVMPVGIESIKAVPGLEAKVNPLLHMNSSGISLLLQDLELINYDWTEKKGKLRFSPSELRYLFNVELRTDATLRHIVFPTMKEETDDVSIQSVKREDAALLLRENLLLQFPNHGDWLSNRTNLLYSNDEIDLFIEELLKTTTTWKLVAPPSKFREATISLGKKLWNFKRNEMVK